jgi:putative acetyltransferase
MNGAIYPYEPLDQSSVKEFILNNLAEFGFTYNKEYDNDLDDPQAYYIDTGGAFYVFKIKGKIIGTIAVINKSKTTAEFKRLYVSKDQQGRGLGSQLIQTALQFCKDKKFTKVVLETNKKFTKAHSLYKTLGFNIIGEDDRSLYMEKIL